MPNLTEGKLKFTFSQDWSVIKYDDCQYYRTQFSNVCQGLKAVDLLAMGTTGECWLLEIKDYREHRRTKPIDIADEIAEKVLNTLAALAAAQFRANDNTERSAARKALRSQGWRVCLHLEQPVKHSKLFPRAINPANVQQKLRKRIKAIDPHPRVVEMNNMRDIPWQVQSKGSC